MPKYLLPALCLAIALSGCKSERARDLVRPVRSAGAEFSGSSIHEVEDFIAANGITTLAEFLPRLSPDYRANFVLMRRSASLQPTKDPLAPRAILFGRDARLVLAFNHQANSLEMMEKQPGAAEFQFKRLNFTPGQPPQPHLVNCNACHQGHPLWGQYRAWPGMYGGDQEMIPSGSPEEADYLRLVRAAETDSLYRNLIFKCGAYYNGGMVPGFVAAGKCAEVSALVQDFSGGERERLERRLRHPAEGMGELLNRQNVDRVFTRMRASTRYEALKYAVAANTLGCLGERVYDYSGDDQAQAQMRNALAPLAQPIAARLAGQAEAQGITGKLQVQLLGLLGIDIAADLRLDLKTPKRRFLGYDCGLDPSYSPNPDCRAGSAGYDSYSDGYDHAPNLLGYLVLREIYGADPAVRARLKAGLEATEAYFRTLPPGSGSGYDSVDSVLRFLRPVLEDLEHPAVTPAGFPKYLQSYPFSQLIRWGRGEEVCRELLAKIN